MKEEILNLIQKEIDKHNADIKRLDLEPAELSGRKIERANLHYGAIIALGHLESEIKHSIRYENIS